jgi:hypothetical protein
MPTNVLFLKWMFVLQYLILGFHLEAKRGQLEARPLESLVQHFGCQEWVGMPTFFTFDFVISTYYILGVYRL